LNYLKAQFIVKLPIACVPNFVFVHSPNKNRKSNCFSSLNKSDWKIFKFFTCIVARCTVLENTIHPSVDTFASAEFCWIWLNRFLEQFFVVYLCEQQAMNDETCEVTSKMSFEDSCECLFIYFKHVGNPLYMRYQVQFEKVLNFLFSKLSSRTSMSEYKNLMPFKRLFSFLEVTLKDKYIPPVYFKNQAPYVVESLLLTK
jgi:hypothetical protein